ncbi:MAG: hypothetical protein Q7T28_00890 [Cypionkella sp.]|uniref:hypothetical protein n=1 Tax=Cypionkella sp. TaxID=2811411 RepID=UPI0027257D14|nr:hypothetical protein [Cypionkella sp.]MDO8325470.1 hypothetical protein [Cypionkella sp.]
MSRGCVKTLWQGGVSGRGTAEAQGVPPEQADLLVRQSFLGAAHMLAEDPRA